MKICIFFKHNGGGGNLGFALLILGANLNATELSDIENYNRYGTINTPYNEITNHGTNKNIKIISSVGSFINYGTLGATPFYAGCNIAICISLQTDATNIG